MLCDSRVIIPVAEITIGVVVMSLLQRRSKPRGARTNTAPVTNFDVWTSHGIGV
jgi:hypothetical protein